MNEPLSTVLSREHIIDRYRGDRLDIRRRDGSAVPPAERAAIATWYWSAVGVKGNDPEGEEQQV